MKFKVIHFIINPASAKEEAVLFFINEIFSVSKINWNVSVTNQNKSAGDIAKLLIGKTDLVVVYGGDGCVTDVASVLHGTNTPMAIIPAGTANIMAKELGISTNTKEALETLKSGKVKIKVVDMGLMNGRPFLLRVNLGIMADMVLEADRDLKNNVGQLAYGVTAIKTIVKARQMSYKLEIDGEIFKEKGVSLTITNCGNIGVGNFSLLPGISITDGSLDVVLMEDNDIASVLKVAGDTVLQHETSALKHWKCKTIVVTMDKAHKFICDDFEQKAKKLKIDVVPASIRIVVPSANNE